MLGDSLSDNGNLFKLIGVPPPPYWEDRSSNRPVYAERLAQMLGFKLEDYAYSYGLASDASPTAPLDPSGNPYPINLSNQVSAYLASAASRRREATRSSSTSAATTTTSSSS